MKTLLLVEADYRELKPIIEALKKNSNFKLELDRVLGGISWFVFKSNSGEPPYFLSGPITKVYEGTYRGTPHYLGNENPLHYLGNRMVINASGREEK